MLNENRVKFIFCCYLSVIYFPHCALTQNINAIPNVARPFIINTVSAYQNSITLDTNKRLVLLEKYVTPLVCEWKYATTGNFTHEVLYKTPVAYVRLPVAIALRKIQQELALKGLGLKFFDAYRPYSVTEKMWQIVPDERYAANPAKGSGHNRATAVDVTLIKISTGKELPMPTGFDDFSEKAHHSYMHLPLDVMQNRGLLKTVMEKYGFAALSTEWWHYSLANTTIRFEILDLTFSQLKNLED